jgi:hypothetical protein
MTSMMLGHRGLKWRNTNSTPKLLKPNQAGHPFNHAGQLVTSQFQLEIPSKPGT